MKRKIILIILAIPFTIGIFLRIGLETNSMISRIGFGVSIITGFALLLINHFMKRTK